MPTPKKNQYIPLVSKKAINKDTEEWGILNKEFKNNSYLKDGNYKRIVYIDSSGNVDKLKIPLTSLTKNLPDTIYSGTPISDQVYEFSKINNNNYSDALNSFIDINKNKKYIKELVNNKLKYLSDPEVIKKEKEAYVDNRISNLSLNLNDKSIVNKYYPNSNKLNSKGVSYTDKNLTKEGWIQLGDSNSFPKFLQNVIVSPNYMDDVVEASKKYNLGRDTIAAGHQLENPNNISDYFNTHDVANLIKDKYKINYPINWVLKQQDKNSNYKAPELTDIIKNNFKIKNTEDAIKKMPLIENAFRNAEEELSKIKSPADAYASMIINRNRNLQSMNSGLVKNAKIKGVMVNNSYDDLVTKAAKVLRDNPKFMNYTTKKTK